MWNSALNLEKFCFFFSPSLSSHSPPASLYLSFSWFVPNLVYPLKLTFSPFFSFHVVPLSIFILTMLSTTLHKASTQKPVSPASLQLSSCSRILYPVAFEMPPTHQWYAPQHSKHNVFKPELPPQNCFLCSDPSTTQKPGSHSSCSLSHPLYIQTIPKTSQFSIFLNIFLNILTFEHHHDFCLCLCSQPHTIHTNHTVRSGSQSYHIPITQHPKLPSTLHSWWSSTQSSSELITRHGIASAPRVSFPLASPFTPDFALHTLIEWPTYSSRTHNALTIHVTIHAISSTWKCSELLVTLPNSTQVSRPSSNTTAARALLWHCHQTASTSARHALHVYLSPREHVSHSFICWSRCLLSY